MVAGFAPRFTLGGNQHTITEIYGVWAVDHTGDMVATGGTQNDFRYKDSYSGGTRIAGWRTNPPNGFVNASNVFTFSSLTGREETIGFHVRESGQLPGGLDTLYISGAPVPEPTTMAALGLGALAMLRRCKSR